MTESTVDLAETLDRYRELEEQAEGSYPEYLRLKAKMDDLNSRARELAVDIAAGFAEAFVGGDWGSVGTSCRATIVGPWAAKEKSICEKCRSRFDLEAVEAFVPTLQPFWTSSTEAKALLDLRGFQTLVSQGQKTLADATMLRCPGCGHWQGFRGVVSETPLPVVDLLALALEGAASP